MHNANKPDASELPSTGQLLKSTAIAAAVASALLVTVVLPAEYGVDPTGVGSVIGLTEMGRIKMQLAEEARAEAAADLAASAPAPATPVEPPPAADAPAAEPPSAGPFTDQQAATWSDTTTVNLAPDQGYEVKLVMEKGAVATFEWVTNGPKVNYDTHGDGSGINYHGYGKGTNVDRLEGKLTAAFTGSHGWFWRNRSGEPLTITLRTTGDYSEIKQYD